MERRTIAVIGSAGRRDDAAKVSRALYDAMYGEALRAIAGWETPSGESGGAALADHLCVRAFLDGAIRELTLFLPARFGSGGFVPNPGVQFNPGRTLAMHHAVFSAACGIDSIAEIAEAVRRGATVRVHEGFQRRNIEVAAACTHMLAFTFGEEWAPEDLCPEDEGYGDPAAAGLRITRGTAHTWKECWRAAVKRHVSLTWLGRTLACGGQPPVDSAPDTRQSRQP